MSEQSTNGPTVSNTTNITSGVKEKNPHRVAAGKRLGAISRQEAKRLECEKQQTDQREAMDHNTEGGGYAVYIVGGLIVVGTVSYLFLNKDRLTGQAKHSDQNRTPSDPADKPPCKKKSSGIFANE